MDFSNLKYINKVYDCDFNPGVGCERKKCEECGWNPEVAKERLRDIISAMREGKVNGVTP